MELMDQQKPETISNPSSEDESTHVKTPPNYVFMRNKRQREEHSPTDFITFKDEMRQLLTSLMTTQYNELKGITLNLKEIQQTNSSIESSIALLTSQNEEFRRKIEQLESQTKKDREYINILEDKIEDLQRLSRKTNIEIKNVPKKNQETREDLIKMVQCLSTTINLDMDPIDIKDIFRLRGRQEGDKTSTIIVELASTILKSDVLKKAKAFNIKNKSKLQAKHLGHTTNEDTPVFISEQLTSKGARLYFLARELIKTKKFKYCWTSFGRVLVRKDDTTRVIAINNEGQVQHLLNEN